MCGVSLVSTGRYGAYKEQTSELTFTRREILPLRLSGKRRVSAPSPAVSFLANFQDSAGEVRAASGAVHRTDGRIETKIVNGTQRLPRRAIDRRRIHSSGGSLSTGGSFARAGPGLEGFTFGD